MSVWEYPKIFIEKICFRDIAEIFSSLRRLISIKEISKLFPRLLHLNISENFLVDCPKKTKCLITLNAANNSITNLSEIQSCFLAKLDVTYNNLEKHEMMCPFLKKENFTWTDSPTSDDPIMTIKNFLNFEKSTELEAHANLLDETLSQPLSAGNLRKNFHLVMKIRSILFSSLHQKYPPARSDCALIIQTWWRNIFENRNLTKKQKRAVDVIEAWWIGTTLRRKIRTALAKARVKNSKSEKINDNTHFPAISKQIDLIFTN